MEHTQQDKSAQTDYNWAEDIDGAVTVCDTEGKVVFMNKRSRETFNKNGQSMVGQNLMPCHNPHSQAIIRDMLENNHSHCYTISKHGQRKLIFQTPWRQDGEVCGLVEFSFVLPDEMPHYDRG
ncbi:MAG: PAS domain-containing protein [Prevotella sp.]|nr:PAS domain-containing protein [Prevotella sp.]